MYKSVLKVERGNKIWKPRRVVRARMPYLRGRACRRGRGGCSSPRGRGRRWQRRQNICNDQSSSSKKFQDWGPPAYSLQLLSDEAWKPRSLCFPTRHPSSPLKTSPSTLPRQTPLSLRQVCLWYVLPAQPSPGVGRCFPVFIGLPSAADQLSVLSQAFSGPQNIIIFKSYQHTISWNFFLYLHHTKNTTYKKNNQLSLKRVGHSSILWWHLYHANKSWHGYGFCMTTWVFLKWHFVEEEKTRKA